MDLDNSFNYVGLRVVKRNPDVHGTSYVADVLINSTKQNDQISAQFKLLRVIVQISGHRVTEHPFFSLY